MPMITVEIHRFAWLQARIGKTRRRAAQPTAIHSERRPVGRPATRTRRGDDGGQKDVAVHRPGFLEREPMGVLEVLDREVVRKGKITE